jgi:hypothetical protein
VGVDGKQWRAMTWVMMWVIMWATRAMAATTHGGWGGGGGSGGGSSGNGNGGGSGCIFQGLYAFYCEDIFVWYFYDVWGGLVWSYFVDSLHFIHDRSVQLVRRQRRLEAKVIGLSAMTCAISCLLVGVGRCVNF